jgi:haloalkane dehalogenase
MKILRTPEDRFENLPGYGFSPNYVDDLAGYEGIRIHYLDEGPRDAARVFLCLHGQPSWSYLYRRMIPIFAGAGHRLIAPDLIGFGRSDKPASDAIYTFMFHREMLMRFVERLDLQNITLVVQDWGGLLGLTLPMDMPERFTSLLIMNTALGTGDVPFGEGFLQWRAWANSQPDMAAGKVIARGTLHLTGAEIAAYDAPFPSAEFKAGVRRFPNLVPDHPDMEGAALSRRARDWWSRDWRGKSFMVIGMQDPVLGPRAMRYMQGIIRDCPAPMEIADGGHFVQEWGEQIAKAALTAL